MVVYAVAANVSIIQVFLAGFLPGLLVMALYSGYIVVWSLLNPEQQPPPEPPMSFAREAARIARTSSPCLLLIILVFATLLFGWATATECAAWGVLGSFAIAWWSGSLTLGLVLGERHGHDAHHLHDHADPRRRVVHVDLDGLYRHPARARRLGRQPAASRPTRSSRRSP